MECMINIINFLDEHDGLIMCLLTLGTLIAAGITAWATRQIMKLNDSQTKIANQKRKDDLFKIRWEFYIEIISRIQEHHIKYVGNKEDNLEPPIYNEGILKKDGMCREEDLKNIFTSDHCFISHVRWLFNDDIANLVQELLIPSSKKVNRYLYLESISYKMYKSMKNCSPAGFHDADTINPTREFTKKFDEYLNLNQSEFS